MQLTKRGLEEFINRRRVKPWLRGETVLITRKKFGENWKQKENGKSKQGEDIKKKNKSEKEKNENEN
jgi:hypothetical protein